jgi:CubicO group peptidase (beta-lactamase class C family)
MNISDPVKAGFDASRLDRLTQWMQRYVDAGKIPFGHVVVSRDGKPVFSSHVGMADVEAQRPYTDDALVRLFSMSKPVTAVAYMQLEEQGLVHLDDPLEKWLPEFADTPVFERVAPRVNSKRPRSRSITMHDLLTHRAGLSYGIFAGDPVSGEYLRRQTDFNTHDGPLSEVCERLATMPLVFDPGERWHYSVSLDVLGRVIEVVSGKTLDQYFRDHIFEPLEMHDTSFQVTADKKDRLTALYTKTADERMKLTETAEESLWADESNPVTCFSGGSGLVGTMADYWKFVEMLRGQGQGSNGARILGSRTVKLMASNHLPGDIASMGVESFAEVSFHGVGFGLGMYSIIDPAKTGMICTPGEFGWGGLASTVFWVDPVEDITTVFLTQQIPSSGYPLRRELRGLVYGALAESR